MTFSDQNYIRYVHKQNKRFHLKSFHKKRMIEECGWLYIFLTISLFNLLVITPATSTLLFFTIIFGSVFFVGFQSFLTLYHQRKYLNAKSNMEV